MADELTATAPERPVPPAAGLGIPVQPALYCEGRAEEFATAAALGFTHALVEADMPLPAVRAAGLIPVLALDSTTHHALADLQAAGAGGFYFREAHKRPAARWRALLCELPEWHPELLLVADIRGATPAEIAALAGVEFDFATSSSCYWDFRSSWLTGDTARTEAVAPALAFATPPGAAPGTEEETRRALRFSAMFAPAWAVGRQLVMESGAGIREEIRTLLALRRTLAPMHQSRAARLVSPPGAPAAVLQRGDFVAIVNSSAAGPATQTASHILPQLGAAALQPVENAAAGTDEDIALAPAAVAFFTAAEPGTIELPAPRLDTGAPRIAIEAVTPQVDEGSFPARRITGETVSVEADLIVDGHGRLAADIIYRCGRERTWHTAPMRPLGNDRWRGEFPLRRLGRHGFYICAWIDRFASLADEMHKKRDAGQPIALELTEALALVDEAARTNNRIRAVAAQLRVLPDEARQEQLLSPELATAMRTALPKQFSSKSKEMPLDAEPLGARFASWYEIFPRSQSGDGVRHGTFDDVIAQLPRIAAMGFDVLYFPPIHPIGDAHRKGRDNTLQARPEDPGSPYAIGSAAGGHDAIHPELGGLEDFRALVAAAARHGLSIALDFAIQCSPDHPWVKDHREWFDWRPDGSLRYAENPPKKYEDIVNVDFYAEGAKPSLWLALRDVVQFWIGQGVRYFRVDNPHTKPLPFWEWMIADIRARHPDVIFLAEAFTRPKMMYRLAKIGFSQSYTYFTWRNEKAELQAYIEELAHGPAREFFRPHFFVNTPDINPYFLQRSGRAGFLIRAALAATLSGLFGVYNGFELCEAAALPGKEEYRGSEKYELKAWDHGRPGNIVAEITALNAMRRENTALQSHTGVEFLPCGNDKVLYFRKYAPDGNTLLVAISLDPHAAQEAVLELPLWRFGLPDDGVLTAEELVRGGTFAWRGKYQRLRLDPLEIPYAVWRIGPIAEAGA